MTHRSRWMALAVLMALCAGAGLAAAEEPLARIRVGPALVEWEPLAADYDRLVLTVTGPCGKVHREFAEGKLPSLNLTDLGDGRDGAYSYELRLVPKLGSDVLQALQAGRTSDDACVVDRLQEEGRLPRVTAQSGSVTISRGAFVPQDRDDDKSAEAVTAGSDDREMGERTSSSPAGKGGGITFATGADEVISDDLIVHGSTCVGFSCVNNESFGLDTIRLKEHSLRIKFDDTSVGSFPSNDWQLTANDSVSGGASRFSIDDVTGARTPFTIQAGAANNSIFVDSSGRVGFRTATPMRDLHVLTLNTPALRLDQSSAGGFAAYTWDIGSNEVGFFVRDVTGGNRLPFRVRPGAPNSSIDIAASGNVGMGGQTNAAHPLHMSSGAHVTAGGTWTNASSRDYKENIRTLSASDAMATLEGLTPVTYKYKNTENEHHVGFIAEDVPALVAEEDRKSLSPMDVVAVLTKVVQEQQKLVRDQQKTIDELAAKVAELEITRNAGN